MTQTYPMRAIGPTEATGFFSVLNEAFNSNWPLQSALEHELITFEFDRSVAAFDGSQIVGTACAYTYQMSVPGGFAPTGGVSAVAVSPTHRRRGIMSGLIRQLLHDIADRGEVTAALFASEAEIYGRFGFGCATGHLRLTIRRGEGTLLPVELPGGQPGAPRLRVAQGDQVHAELAAVYAAEAARRPGMPDRDDRWWRATTADPEWARDGMSQTRCLLAEDDSGPRGYALYAVKPDWDTDGVANNRLHVGELIATDPVAAAALWADLLTRDLTGEVTARLRPTDDPLLHLLAGRRRARAQLNDGLWIRLVDVPGALSQRQYACPVDVVIEVADPLLPGNAGRWRLRADAAGKATCERSAAEPDVIAPVRALGAAYLGGTRLAALAAAGQVAEQRPGALAALSAAMSWDPAPWCPMVF